MYLKVDLHECMPSNYEAPGQITSALSAAVLFFFGHSRKYVPTCIPIPIPSEYLGKQMMTVKISWD